MTRIDNSLPALALLAACAAPPATAQQSMEKTMTNAGSHDLTPGQLDALVAKMGGRAEALRVLSGEAVIQLLPGDERALPSTSAMPRSVSIPPDVAFEERVARGHYGWRHPSLTEKGFPITADRAGDWEHRLFHFNRSISSQQAIDEIRATGFEPAQTGDILAFGETYPEVQRRHPVVGLGSVKEIDTSLSVPSLWFDGDSRTLDLIWWDGDWHRNYRFLGVRKR